MQLLEIAQVPDEHVSYGSHFCLFPVLCLICHQIISTRCSALYRKGALDVVQERGTLISEMTFYILRLE